MVACFAEEATDDLAPFLVDAIAGRFASAGCGECRERGRALLAGELVSESCPVCELRLDDAILGPRLPGWDSGNRVLPGWYVPLRLAVARDLELSPRRVPLEPDLAASAALYWLAMFLRGEQSALELLGASIEARPEVSAVRSHGPAAGEPFEVVVEWLSRSRNPTGGGRSRPWFEKWQALWIDADGFLIDGLFGRALLAPEELARLEREIPEAGADLRAALHPEGYSRETETLVQCVAGGLIWGLRQ